MSAQEQWRFCTNCGGLFYAGPGFGKGVCPARSGGHAKGKSHNYVLAYPPLPATDPAVTPQGNWRFCTKCGGLFFARALSWTGCVSGRWRERLDQGQL